MANAISVVILSRAPSDCIEFEDLTSFDIVDKLTENLNFDKPFGVEQKYCSE